MPYKLRLFGPSGRLVAVQRLYADTDKEAVTIAATMVRGASAVESFDLWDGERHIHGAAPTIREREKPRR